LEKKECLIIYRQIPGEEEGFPSGWCSHHKGGEVFMEEVGMEGRAKVYDGELAGLKMGASMVMKSVANPPRNNEHTHPSKVLQHHNSWLSSKTNNYKDLIFGYDMQI
jgi:hypothetical protein